MTKYNFYLFVDTTTEKEAEQKCARQIKWLKFIIPNYNFLLRSTNRQGQKKTFTITKQCCHGFARSEPHGYCEKVELHSLSEVAEKLNTKSFVEVAENNGLKDVMQTNVTLFMPTDESFKTYTQDALNEADGGSAMKELLLNHIVKNLVDVEEIDNEQILTTEDSSHTIRLNVFPKIRNRRQEGEEDGYRYLYTANCVPIMKANQRTINGIVHKTRGVLKPVTQNLMDLIRSRSDMSVLRTVLEKTQMDKKLDEGKDFTIFAPTDAAFEKLDAQFKRKIKEGGSCAESKFINR
jgi:transforming growth factor-beta-induced protein